MPKCLSAGVISQVFPLHDQPALQQLRHIWVRSFAKTQPLGTFLHLLSRMNVIVIDLAAHILSLGTSGIG